MMNLTTAATNPAPPAIAGVPPAAATQPAGPGALLFAQWLGQGEQAALAPPDDAVAAPLPCAGDGGNNGNSDGVVAPAAAADTGVDLDAAAGTDNATAAAGAAQLASMAAPWVALALPAAASFAATVLPGRRGDAATPAPLPASPSPAPATRPVAATAPLAAPDAAALPLAAGGPLPMPGATMPGTEKVQAAAEAGVQAAADTGAQAGAPAQPVGAAARAAGGHEAPADAPAERAVANVAAWGVGSAPTPAPQGRPADSVTLAGPPAAWRQSLHEALGERLGLQLTNRADQAVIRLDPPNLGRVEIAIRHSAGGLEVNISATHGEVLRQLHAVSDGLRNDLAQRQFTEVAVTVSPAARGAGPAPFGEPQGRARQGGREQEQTAPGLGLLDAGAHPDSTFSLTGRE